MVHICIKHKPHVLLFKDSYRLKNCRMGSVNGCRNKTVVLGDYETASRLRGFTVLQMHCSSFKREKKENHSSTILSGEM